MEIFLSEQERVFLWLLLKDHLSTRALLRRRNMHLAEYHCVLCHQAIDEDLLHLFFHCPFSIACWYTLRVLVPNSDDTCSIIESFRNQLNLPFFMEIIITMCWSIWTMRNDAIFRGIPHSVHRCKLFFRKEFARIILRAKATFHPLIDSWLGTFV
jgi:hypothetical protein